MSLHCHCFVSPVSQTKNSNSFFDLGSPVVYICTGLSWLYTKSSRSPKLFSSGKSRTIENTSCYFYFILLEIRATYYYSTSVIVVWKTVQGHCSAKILLAHSCVYNFIVYLKNCIWKFRLSSFMFIFYISHTFILFW